MAMNGSLHVREPEPRGDGTYTAVSLFERPPFGVMVWAGRVCAEVAHKPVEEICFEDYVAAERVSFSRWEDALDYFADREYAHLLDRVRDRLSSRAEV